jgi:hypothetical protein
MKIGRRISKKSAGVRERRRSPSSAYAIGDLVGSVEGLPKDLSACKKRYLRLAGYGRTPRAI